MSPQVLVHRARLAVRLVGMSHLLLLASTGIVMQVGWVMIWALSYRLNYAYSPEFVEQYLQRVPILTRGLQLLLALANRLGTGIEPPHSLAVLVNGLEVAFAVVGLGYLGGVLLLDHDSLPRRAAIWIVLGFALLYQVTVFLLPGFFSTDIFSYVMYGRIAGVDGGNPYVAPPDAFPNDPFLGWVYPFWRGQPSVYGPLWTDLSWALAKLFGWWRPLDQVLAYKVVLNAFELVNMGLVWWLLGRFQPDGGSPRARLTAFAVFAWNPLVLFELAGNVHNDSVMLTFLLMGLIPLAGPSAGRRWFGAGQTAGDGPRDVGRRLSDRRWSMATLVIGLSALVKYATGVVGLFCQVAWARRLPRARQRLAWLGGTTLLLFGVGAALAWPWLQLPDVLVPLGVTAGGQRWVNSVPDLLALTIADQVLDPHAIDRDAAHAVTRFWMGLATRGLFLAYLALELRWLWAEAGHGGQRAVDGVIRASTRALLALPLLVLTWVWDWYFAWPLALAVLLGWRSTLAKITVGYTLIAPPVFYAHQYWNTLMPGAGLLLYAGLPLLLPLARRVPTLRVPGAIGDSHR